MMDTDYKINTTEEDNVTSNDELNDDIITDVYDSLCSLYPTEIDFNDKHSMNINQFGDFFEKYIYSSLSLQNSKQICIFESNKDNINTQLFNHICSKYNLNNSIPFQHVVLFIEKLQKHTFRCIINKTEINATTHNESNHCNHINTIDNTLQIINEHLPLTNPKNNTVIINEMDMFSDDSNETNETNEINETNKKQLILRLRRVKKKLKDIRGLERKLMNKQTLDSNQTQKIENKKIYENEREIIENQLTQLTRKEFKQMELDGKFIYRLYEHQCVIQRNIYKQQNEEMRDKLKKYLMQYKELEGKNKELRIENMQLMKYKQENIQLRKQLAKLAQSHQQTSQT